VYVLAFPATSGDAWWQIGPVDRASRSVGVVPLSMALQIVRFTWEDVAPLVQSVVPPLSSFDHKGSMGRIGVIGGSIEHCGAPYYAAISAIKLGSDLAWVYCSQAAAVPVKAYSPELIVIPFYDDKVVLEMDNSFNPEQFRMEVGRDITHVRLSSTSYSYTFHMIAVFEGH
jgi:hypothetical protein